MWKGVLVFAGPLGLTGAQDALYRNEGDGTFRNVTRQAHVERAEPTYGLAALFCDYDRDGDPDLYVVNDSAPNFLYRNEGGTFREIGVAAGVALSAEGIAQAGMGIAYGDYDRDGFGDFLVTHFEDDYNTLYRNRRDGTFAVASAATGLAEPSLPHLAFGTCFLDYDNDQDQDLFVANGHVYPQIRHLNPDGYAEPNQLFANEGPAASYRFSTVAAGDLSLPAVSRGAAKGDYDNDGDVDLLVFNLDGPPSLLRNDSGNQLNWLSLLLVGTASNRDGIGARIAVISGGVEQTAERVSGGSFLSHSDGRIHFGLGANTAAERIEIHWPAGRTQHLEDVAANQFLVVEEPGPALILRQPTSFRRLCPQRPIPVSLPLHSNAAHPHRLSEPPPWHDFCNAIRNPNSQLLAMAEFDTVTKQLIHTFPHDFARFACPQDDIQVLGVVDTEQHTVKTHRTDSLIHVCIDGQEALVHHEFQTTDSDPPPCRSAWPDTSDTASGSTSYRSTPPSSICVPTPAGTIRGIMSKSSTATGYWCSTR